MKVRNIILFAICFIAVALVCMFFGALVKHNSEMARIERIPNLALATIDGEVLSLSELTSGQKTAILFFSPDCEFCKKEIDGIIAERNTLSCIQWVFVTISSYEDLSSFLTKFQLNIIPGAKICIEEYPELHMALGVTSPPSLFIYDTNGKLEHYRRGAVSIKTILEWLR